MPVTKGAAFVCHRLLEERLRFCIEAQAVLHPSDCGLQAPLQFGLVPKLRLNVSSPLVQNLAGCEALSHALRPGRTP